MVRAESAEAFDPSSVPRAFERAADTWPDRVALRAEGGLGVTYTYASLKSQVQLIANGLSRDELRDTKLVGILAENRPEWVITYLAILTAGKTVVPIDSNLTISEISRLISQADVRLFFCSKKHENNLAQISRDLTLFSFDEESSLSWHRLHRRDSRPLSVPPTEPAVLIFTSGTTGNPKIVQLTHRNLLSNIEGATGTLQAYESDIFLSVLPLHHTLETTCGFLIPIMSGASIVYARSLKSTSLLDDIARCGATCMCGVPLLYEKISHGMKRKIKSAPLMNRAAFRAFYAISSAGRMLGLKLGQMLFRSLRKRAGLDTIRVFLSGGAAMPREVQRFFNLIGLTLIQGYGLTETSPVVSAQPLGDVRFGSVGPPLCNVEVNILNPDRSGVGEIIVRGPSVTPGYRDNPKATAELIKDGWLHTGDLGRLKGGHLWITGRAKNVIVSAAGKNIYPEELEEKLQESQYILEAIVFGRKKEGREGEEVRALVVPDLEQISSEIFIDIKNPDDEKIKNVIRAIVDQINSEVAGYKRIVAFDVSLNELEKTSTKKVKRFLYH